LNRSRHAMVIVASAYVVSAFGGCGPIGVQPLGSYSELLLVTELGAQDEWAQILTPLIAREVDYVTDREPAFRITAVAAEKMRDFPAYKNVVMCGVLEPTTSIGQQIAGLLEEADARRVRDESAVIVELEDRPSRNQFTMILTAANAAALRELIAKRAGEIDGILERSCRARIRRGLLEQKNGPLMAELHGRYGFTIEIPTLYRVLSEGTEPPGVELVREPPTRILGVFWTERNAAPTVDDAEELFRIRADYAWKRYDNDEMDRERASFERARIGSYDAVKMAGYWYNERDVVGGCFATYYIYDPSAKLLWGLDLLVFAPGRPKHAMFRELLALAETFRY